MLYSIGDFALVRVNEFETLVFEVDFYNPNYVKFAIREFEIIGYTNNNYYILAIPSNINQDTIVIEAAEIKKWNLPLIYLGAKVICLLECAVGGRRRYDPYKNALSCAICENSYPYAVANRPNGTLICWSCRDTKGYLIE